MTGLKELTVHGAKSIADAHAKHRWVIPPDYNAAVDCLDRPFHDRSKICLFYEDDEGHTATYTWGQMIVASNKFANALRGLGVGRGDVVAVHTPQRPETAIIHMALYRIGAIGLPISKLFGPDAIQYRLEHSAAKAILMEPETVGKLDGVRQSVATLKHVIVCGGKAAGLPGEKVAGLSFDDLLEQGLDRFTPDRASQAEDPFLLMYTSGTTGNPKGVLHVSRYLLGHNGIDYSYDFLRDGDLYYSMADWAWAGGLLDGLLAIWPYGTPVLAYRSKARFDPEVTLRLLEKYGATVGLYPPTALKSLREIKKPRERFKDLKLRCIVSGAEPVSPELARWVNEELKVGFNQGFGQTEANYFIGTCGALEPYKLEPLGKPFPGHRVAVVDSEGQPVKNRDVGEIAISRESPVVMKEYWKNPEAMQEKFKGEWCVTGDMGFADDEGYVYFQGRGDDVIKTSGYRVGPAEIEAKVIEVKGVASCAVIGVSDPQRGQAIKAFVKVLPGTEKSDALIRQIQEHVRRKLAAHEYPREIEFIDEFPMTVTGKVRRRDLREAEEKKRKATH
ncbi:MAG: AMP-binding protein [Deltaproteobacteria bacterium]|nr:AMP-binding protein [Deltaproteobacteria bacterium]